MTKTIRLSLAITAFVALAVAAPLWAANQVEAEHVLSMDYVTPHVTWARPYAGGVVKALFFVDGRGTHARDLVELAERFDIQPTAVYFVNGKLYGGDEGTARVLRLLQEPFDVYVLANVRMDGLPLEAQYLLLRAVTRGAGLVAVGPSPGEVMAPKRALAETPASLLAGTPLASLPAAQPAVKATGLATPTDPQVAAKIITAYHLGKGRGVALNFHCPAWSLCPQMTFSYPALTEYEYWMSLAGRCVLWAAGKPPVITCGETAAPLTFDREALPVKATVSLTNTDRRPHKLQIALTLRSADGMSVISLPPATVSLEGGGVGEVQAQVPSGLPAGQYYLETIARQAGQVLGFGAIGIRFTSDAGVDNLALDADYCEPGQTLAGIVATRGALPGDTVRLQVRDCYRRVVQQQDLPAAPHVPFKVTISPVSATNGMQIQASLMRVGRELESKTVNFRVPLRRHGQFNMVIWDYPKDVMGYYALMKLRDLGIDIVLASGPPGEVMAAANMSDVPYTTRLLDHYDKNGVMKPVCWNDEPAVTKWVQGIVDKQEKAREQGVFVYSLGDEVTTKGACQSPACRAAYRKWLQGQYGTLEALNREWQSKYTSWDQVGVLDPQDNWEMGALRQGLTARWYDRLHFARENFARLCGRFVKAFKQLDPQAITGFEGAGRFGDDYETIVKTNGFWSPYPGLGDEIIRSIAPRSFIRANWMGYDKQADQIISRYWRMVTLGYDSVWYWRWDGIGQWHGYLMPSGDAYPQIKALAKDTSIVRDGLGDLLLHSQQANDGVAIYYSFPSAWAGKLHHSSSLTAPANASQGFVDATRDLGLEFNYLTYSGLTGGGLKGYKVLVLPFIQSLDEKEATAIRAFAENGGVVIADLRPGVMDGHLKWRGHGLLDDFFGITRGDQESGAQAAVQLQGQLGSQTLHLDLGELPVDPAVKATAATAMGQAGGAPILLRHAVGKGQAILLNFDFSSYSAKRGTGAEAGLSELLAALYAAGGVQPPITITNDNQPVRGTQLFRWHDGGIELIAGLAQSDNKWYPAQGYKPQVKPTRKGVIHLPEKRYVYDLRHHSYLGETASIPAGFYPGRANFYALSPYRIPPLRMTVSEASPHRGDRLQVSLGLDLPREGEGLHAVKLSAKAPNGERAWWVEQVVLLHDGHATVTLPVAYNEAKGQWTLTARELLSNQTAQVQYTVQ